MSLRTELEKLSENNWSNDIVLFRPVKTEDDLIYAAYDCQLEDEQKDLVNPAWFSIGRAYLSREDNYPCIICNKKSEPIGFINLCKWLGNGDGYSWSFFVDRKQQGKGYGRKAAELAIKILKAANKDKMVKLATEQCNMKAQNLYFSLGFVQLPELDGDDLVFGL